MTRRWERGLSVLEVLIMLAVGALATAMVLPVIGQGVRADFGLAQNGLSRAAQQRGEAAFRDLLGGALPMQAADDVDTPLIGDASSMTMDVILDRPSACTLRPGLLRVVLRVENSASGGVLRCLAPGRDAVLARWAAGRGAFAYGDPASGWKGQPGGAPPLYVRFQVVGGSAEAPEWIERAPLSHAPLATADDGADRGGGDLDR